MSKQKAICTEGVFKQFIAAHPLHVKGMFLQYLGEWDNQGYEGFTTREVAAVRKFIADFAVCMQCTTQSEVSGSAVNWGPNLPWDGVS